MLVLKLGLAEREQGQLSGDIWGQIHQVLNLHVHIQILPDRERSPALCPHSALCLQPLLWAVHGAGKYLAKIV